MTNLCIEFCLNFLLYKKLNQVYFQSSSGAITRISLLFKTYKVRHTTDRLRCYDSFPDDTTTKRHQVSRTMRDMGIEIKEMRQNLILVNIHDVKC